MELKTAIVTGGSRGIGAAITRKFAACGIQVAVVYAGNETAAQAICDSCQTEYGVKVLAYRCDVSQFEETRAVVAAIKADFGGVDILVNNAGITRDGLIARMKEDDFDAVINTNLKGAFHMIRQCSPIFMRNRSGRIVNISSVVGISGNAGQSNYAASKAGIIGLTKSVAKELASRGVTCNAVAPGFIDTDMTKGLDETGTVLAQIPLGRVGTPEDVAEAVVFLTQSSYITGEVIRVDGGMAI